MQLDLQRHSTYSTRYIMHLCTSPSSAASTASCCFPWNLSKPALLPTVRSKHTHFVLGVRAQLMRAETASTGGKELTKLLLQDGKDFCFHVFAHPSCASAKERHQTYFASA